MDQFRTSVRDGCGGRCTGRSAPKPLVELRPSPPARYIANGDRDGLLLADENQEPLAMRNPGVEQISLQHRVVLDENWDDYRGIFRALALMDRGGIGRNQRVEFAEAVGH